MIRRRLFSLASLLSLLLCVLASAAFALQRIVDSAGAVYITVPLTFATGIAGVDSRSSYLCISSVGKGGSGI